MNLWNFVRRSAASSEPLDFDEWVNYFNYLGSNYPLLGLNQTLTSKEVEPDPNFTGYAHGLYGRSGIVFACILARQTLFAEATFKFRRRRDGRPGELFGTNELALLEEPWPGGTTGDLLGRMLLDSDLGGNAYIARKRRLHRLRPDWVTIVLGSNDSPEEFDPNRSDVEVIAYAYQPGGKAQTSEPEIFFPDQVAHFMPIPDPINSWRGMSWLTPIVREVMADTATTTHRLNYLEKGATPSMVVSLDASIQREAFEKWIEVFEHEHVGAHNAFKTLYLGAGADVEVVGSDLRRMDFRNVQAGGENRVVTASGVPPIIVGTESGLDSSSFSNFSQARRLFADKTMRPLWRNACGSLARLIDVPGDAELWYDGRDIAFLQDDAKDEAEVQEKQAAAINTFVTAGFTAKSAVAAVVANDFTLLKHSGMVSVQLLPPGSTKPGSTNGAGAEPAPATN